MATILEISLGRMVIADKFDSERDHMRLAAGVDRINLANGVTCRPGAPELRAAGLFYLDGVLAVWNMSISQPGLTHDMSTTSFEVGR